MSGFVSGFGAAPAERPGLTVGLRLISIARRQIWLRLIPARG